MRKQFFVAIIFQYLRGFV